VQYLRIKRLKRVRTKKKQVRETRVRLRTDRDIKAGYAQLSLKRGCGHSILSVNRIKPFTVFSDEGFLPDERYY